MRGADLDRRVCKLRKIERELAMARKKASSTERGQYLSDRQQARKSPVLTLHYAVDTCGVKPHTFCLCCILLELIVLTELVRPLHSLYLSFI